MKARWLGLTLATAGTLACSRSAIHGTVVDVFGSPLPGVEVHIEKTAFKATTGADGVYQLDYAPSDMKVAYSKSGFSSYGLDLKINQKSDFPAEQITLYPLPEKPGIYWVDKKRKRLQMLSGRPVLHQEFVGAWQRRDVYVGTCPDVLDAVPIVDAGDQQFLDADPRNQFLVNASQSGIMADITSSFGNIQKYDVRFVPEKPTKVAPSLWVRTAQLKAGCNMWLDFAEPSFGSSRPVPFRNSTYYSFTVR